MGFGTFYSEDPLWSFEGVSSDCIFPKMSRTGRGVGKEHVEGFLWEDVHDPVGRQRDVFLGKSWGILNGAQPPSRACAYAFACDNGWMVSFRVV